MAWDYERRRGDPRSEAERAERHEQQYPGETLPPRGTGLDRVGSVGAVAPSSGILFMLGLLGGFGALIYIGSRK